MTFVFTKDTIFTGNVAPGCATAIYTLKTALVAGGWTVMSSGTGDNGTGNGVYNSSGDAVTTAALMNNRYAWFRIRAPSGTKEFTFQRANSSTTDERYWRIKVSLTGFTGGSPSALRTPSGGVSETVLYGPSSDTDITPTGWLICTNADNRGMRAQIGVDYASPYGWFLIANDGSTAVREFAFVMDPIDGYSQGAGDPDPYIYYFAGFSSTGAVDRVGNNGYMSAYNTNNTSYGPYAYYSSSVQAWPILAGQWRGQYSLTTYLVIPTSLGTNIADGYDTAFPIPWFRLGNINGYGGFKGMGSMMFYPTSWRGVGNTFSVYTTSDRYALADIMLPWDGTTPNI